VHKTKLIQFLAKEIINRLFKSNLKKRKQNEDLLLIETQKENLFLLKNVNKNALL
jgi:hypothetical protein